MVSLQVHVSFSYEVHKTHILFFSLAIGNNFHNRDGYVRKDLSPQHQPTLGEYNDSDPAVIAQHIRWSQQANIGLWITSWWGPNRIEDSNTKDVILPHPDLGDLKVALHYETTGRIKDDINAG